MVNVTSFTGSEVTSPTHLTPNAPRGGATLPDDGWPWCATPNAADCVWVVGRGVIGQGIGDQRLGKEVVDVTEVVTPSAQTPVPDETGFDAMTFATRSVARVTGNGCGSYSRGCSTGGTCHACTPHIRHTSEPLPERWRAGGHGGSPCGSSPSTLRGGAQKGVRPHPCHNPYRASRALCRSVPSAGMSVRESQPHVCPRTLGWPLYEPAGPARRVH